MILKIRNINTNINCNDLDINYIYTFDQAIKEIYKVGRVCNFSNNFIACLEVSMNEVDKIPMNLLKDSEERKFKANSTWQIFINMKGMIICEFISDYESRIVIDYFDHKNDYINKGDIIYCDFDQKYYLVLNKLNEGFNYRSLFGTGDFIDNIFDESIPMFYIHKVSNQECNYLNLKKIYSDLYDKFSNMNEDEYDDYLKSLLKEYTWL